MWAHRFSLSWLSTAPGFASPNLAGSTESPRFTAAASWKTTAGVTAVVGPTPAALEAGAASSVGPYGQGRSVFWSRPLCTELLNSNGYTPMSRSLQVEQWTQLLEALQLGSPSISATADQMAEEMPSELVEDVNRQLKVRGCSYRVPPHNTSPKPRVTMG